MLRAALAAYKRRTPQALAYSAALLVLGLQSLTLPYAVSAGSTKQGQPPQALGSLSKIGEVYVNDAPVTAPESTIFSGDKLRTGENGVASFTVSGRGTLKFSPNTFAVFAGTDQYVADLRSGTVVASSFSGPSGLSVRIGGYIVVPAVQEQQTTVKVERTLAGAAHVSCLEGSVSVVSTEGAAGLLLQSGQSSVVSTAGELSPESAAAPAAETPPTAPPEIPETTKTQPAPPTPTTTNPPSAPVSHKGWIILGAAGGGAAIIAIAASHAGGSHTPVSPSAP